MALSYSVSLPKNNKTVVRQVNEVLAEDLEEILLLLFCNLLLVLNYTVYDGREQTERVR